MFYEFLRTAVNVVTPAGNNTHKYRHVFYLAISEYDMFKTVADKKVPKAGTDVVEKRRISALFRMGYSAAVLLEA